MNNNQLIAVFAVALIVVAGVGIAYVMMQGDDARDNYTLTINGTENGAALIGGEPLQTKEDALTFTFNANEVVKLSAAADSDYYFTGWSGDISGMSPYYVTMDSDKTITANFGDTPPEDGTVIDARGREVSIPDKIDSILGIKSCSLQLVSYFDAVYNVTHLDRNESFTDADSRTHNFVMKELLQNLPRVDPNDAEQVVAADVDIVISSTIDISKLNEEQSKYGVPVFAVNADVEFDTGILFNQIIALGKLFGEEERAEEIADGIMSFVSDLSKNTAHVDGVTAYACGMNFFGAAQEPFERTSGDYLPFVYSKIDNVYGSKIGKQPYNVTKEDIISKDPQMIFIDGIGLASAVDYINSNIGTLSEIDAISNGEIYRTMVYKQWGTNWVNQLINVYYVASIVHEGEFDWNFEDKANEIIQLFYPGTEVTYSDLAAAQAGGGCGKVTL